MSCTKGAGYGITRVSADQNRIKNLPRIDTIDSQNAFKVNHHHILVNMDLLPETSLT